MCSGATPSALQGLVDFVRAPWGAPAPSPQECERCRETALPLAEALGVPLDDSHGGESPGAGPGGGNAGAARAILTSLAAGGPVLAVWEHHNIRLLAMALGAPAERTAEDWPGFDFDSVFVLRLDTAPSSSEALVAFDRASESFGPPL